MKRRRHVTRSLQTSAREAKELGLLEEDYYSLNSSQRDMLEDLLAHTKWKQGKASKGMGRSQAYAFHVALRKQSRGPVVRRKRRKSRTVLERR